MSTAPRPTATDGRRARRDRNRAAVIDATYALLSAGQMPSTEAIAERAGVSVSSIFRYFDSIDDLQRETIAIHLERHGDRFRIPAIGEGPQADRIARLVDARVRLHASVAPVARMARARAVGPGPVADQLAHTRAMIIDQLGIHFAPELGALAPAKRDDTIALLDVVSSFESWDLLVRVHGRTDRQVRRAMTTGLSDLLARTD